MRPTSFTTALSLALVVVAAVLASCSSDDGDEALTSCVYGGQVYELNEQFPSLDGCNSCACIDGEVRCTLVACACTADETCANGPSCGGTCCAAGEHCEVGVCKCGANPACGAGQTCQPSSMPEFLGCGYSCVP
jgi:hypothetical protein